jgi:hypothetical protein
MKPDDVRYWMGADDFGPCIKYVRCLEKASRGLWPCEIDDGEQITETLWTKKEYLSAPFTRIEEAEAALATLLSRSYSLIP